MNRNLGKIVDRVEIEIEMLKQEEAADEKRTDSSEPDDGRSSPQYSPRMQVKAKRAVEVTGSGSLNERPSNKYLPYNSSLHWDWDSLVLFFISSFRIHLSCCSSVVPAFPESGSVLGLFSGLMARRCKSRFARCVKLHRRSACAASLPNRTIQSSFK